MHYRNKWGGLTDKLEQQQHQPQCGPCLGQVHSTAALSGMTRQVTVLHSVVPCNAVLHCARARAVRGGPFGELYCAMTGTTLIYLCFLLMLFICSYSGILTSNVLVKPHS